MTPVIFKLKDGTHTVCRKRGSSNIVLCEGLTEDQAQSVSRALVSVHDESLNDAITAMRRLEDGLKSKADGIFGFDVTEVKDEKEA